MEDYLAANVNDDDHKHNDDVQEVQFDQPTDEHDIDNKLYWNYGNYDVNQKVLFDHHRGTRQ